MTHACGARSQMEETLRRGEECSCPLQCAAEVRSLPHLERHIDSASSSVVIIAFYSRARPFVKRGCSAGRIPG